MDEFRPFSFVLPATDWVNLLTGAVPFAALDEDPSLNVIFLTAQGRILQAVATDGCRLAVSSVVLPAMAPDQPQEWDFLLSAASARHLVLTYEACPWDEELMVTIEAGSLVVDTVGLLGPTSELATMYLRRLGEFPPYRELLNEAVGEPASVVRVSPYLLATFAEAARQSDACMDIVLSTPDKPVLVRIGDYFVGLLMPIKYKDELAERVEGQTV
jgi:hypothetical protein